MEKRYQVFVSSTYQDLKEERKEVMQVLLEMDCIPSSMELFPAASSDQWTYIKKVIDNCDYYLVIVGGRYGSLTPEGLSYTEAEYDYALSKNIPTIGFLHEDIGELPSKKVEMDQELRDRLAKFRGKLERRLCKYWKTSGDLSNVVARSLMKLMKDNPAEGWVRARYASDPAALIELREKVLELESTRKSNPAVPPSGTDALSSGDDVFPFKLIYRTGTLIRGQVSTKTVYNSKTVEVKVSWNHIFSGIGPLMLDEASETQLAETLLAQLKAEAPAPPERTSIVLEGNDFHTIIVQFMALGLIQKSEKRRSAKETSPHWSLTPFGEASLMRLKAVKKSGPISS